MENVLVVFGGKSFEHDISIITALLVMNRAKSKYKLLPVYIDKNNEWFFYEKNNLSAKLFKDFKPSSGFKKAYLRGHELLVKRGIKDRKIKVHAILNCCHGGIGENGALCGLCEAYGVPITSGGTAGLSVSMDKLVSKYVFRGIGIRTINYTSFTRSEAEKDINLVAEKIEGELGYPVILKPARLGSSIGISVAKTRDELLESIRVAIEFDSAVLVEEAYLDMKEYNVAVMKDKGEIIVSGIDMPTKTDEILSFKDKYIGSAPANKQKKIPSKKGGSYLCEKKLINVEPKLEKTLKTISKEVYEKLGLTGVVRVDFICVKNKVYLNEINTVPGSLGYYFFCPSRFKSMGAFVDALIDEARLEFQNKCQLKEEFITNIF